MAFLREISCLRRKRKEVVAISLIVGKSLNFTYVSYPFFARFFLEIDDDAIGNRPLAAGSENLAFRQQDGIVPEEKHEVVNDNFLDLFFGLELKKSSSKYLPFFVQFHHFPSKSRLNLV